VRITDSPLKGIQDRIVKAQREASASKQWPYIVAEWILGLSLLPWAWYFLLRRIQELREAIVGK